VGDGAGDGAGDGVAQGKVCTFESDEDRDRSLEAWRDGLLHGAFAKSEGGKLVVSSVSEESSSSSSSSGDDEGDGEGVGWMDPFGGEVNKDGTTMYRF